MTHPSPANVQATFAATLADEWIRCGVDQVYVSPGSRSTPLAVALAGNGRFHVDVVLDERSAAFRALGYGIATGRPALVLTTSGTAAVHLHPAIVEAHQARVPLVAVTADRPPELHHVGAPQTVEQARLYGDAVRWAFDPGPPDAAFAAAWRSLAARVVIEAVGNPAGPGPVHLNLPFREPLLGTASPLPPGRPDGRPWHRPEGTPALPPAALVEELAGSGQPGLIVAGGGAGEAAAIQRAAAVLGWPVLADPRSGARTPSGATVAAADALLRSESFAGGHRPEIVLRLGGSWASRVVNTWLANLDAEQVVVDPHGTWPDPDRTASVVAACDPTILCLALAEAGATPADPAWLEGWAAAECAAQRAIDVVLGRHDVPTEPGIARDLVAALPDDSALVVSSSMPVRDVEWYAQPRDGLRVLSNRGANGIDGVLSTAFGVSRARRAHGPTAVLLGDLAFLHDQGALLGAVNSGIDCTIVVVDNDGGGIFSFLPQAGALPVERFEQLFGTPTGADIAAIAAAHGVPVTQPETVTEVSRAVTEAVASGGVRLIHVRTNRQANVAVHDEIHQAVIATLL